MQLCVWSVLRSMPQHCPLPATDVDVGFGHPTGHDPSDGDFCLASATNSIMEAVTRHFTVLQGSNFARAPVRAASVLTGSGGAMARPATTKADQPHETIVGWRISSCWTVTTGRLHRLPSPGDCCRNEHTSGG